MKSAHQHQPCDHSNKYNGSQGDTLRHQSMEDWDVLHLQYTSAGSAHEYWISRSTAWWLNVSNNQMDAAHAGIEHRSHVVQTFPHAVNLVPRRKQVQHNMLQSSPKAKSHGLLVLD